jgi:hypothetical protein
MERTKGSKAVFTWRMEIKHGKLPFFIDNLSSGRTTNSKILPKCTKRGLKLIHDANSAFAWAESNFLYLPLNKDVVLISFFFIPSMTLEIGRYHGRLVTL